MTRIRTTMPSSATRLSDPTLGTIDSFNADGSFSYTPGEPSGITIGLQLKCETSLSDFVTSAGTASAADVDNDGDVELVGMSYFGLGAGVFVVDPTDCSAVASRIPFDSGQPLSDAVVTLVNLDDDPELEVVATYFRFGVDLVGSADFGEDDNRLMAFELDGTPVAGWPRHGVSHKPAFDTGFNAEWKQASPVAADLNGDGTPELLMGYTQVGSSGLPEGICRAVVANTTCNAVVAWDGRTGTVLWTYIGGVTGPNQRSMTPTIVDLDMDGDTEIIWNQLVLDHEGNLVFELPVERTILVAGFELYGNAMFTSAIGNFDNDAFPEIVGYDDRNFYLFSHDGGIQWQRPYNGGGFDFPWADLTLAELDGDPFPELVTMITGPDDAILTLRAFDSDGEPLWDQADDYAVRGFAQTRTSSAVAIDLDRDGIDELIQFKTLNPSSDVSGLYIIDGATGSIIDSIVDPALGVSNDRGDEPLTVADLDGDGSVEIVTNFNREFGFDRLQIWDNLPGEPFPPGRPIRSQTNVQPTWVNVDGSLPTSLEPHWLQPGRNYWNRIVPDLDPLAPEEDSFTYRVSDGEFDSAPATVNIEVRPNGNPPFFLSDPDDATSAGIAYRYQPLVVDVDPGDSFTFELLNGPAGMTIDPASGALDWYPEANGDFPVSIAVTDTLGLSAAQIFTLAVGDPVEVPDVVGQTEAGAESTLTGAGLLLGSRLRRSDPAVPAGQVLAQEPPAGAVADLGASVRVTLSSGPSALDTDGDGDGFTPNEGDCNDDDNTIYPAAPEIDGDGIDQSCNGIDGDKILASIEVTPESKRLITGEPQPMRALGIFEDGTAQDLTGVVAWTRGPTFFSADAGSFTAEATLDGVTGSAAFTVLERVDEDAAPVARILTPGNGDTLTAPTTVTGTVFDVNVVRWELAYQYAGEDDFVTFAEGASTRSAAPLGDFDPTTLLNGLYTIRLQVFDAGGNVSEDSTTVQVEGQMKVGPFSINYVDLEIPMSGVPIAVERVYDSRDKRRGDLGVGWRLGINSLEVRTTENLGREWQVIRSGLSYRIVETQVHRASVRLPDGRIEAFQMVVSPSASPIIPFPPFTQAVSFRPLPGTLGTLESLEENTVSILDAQPGPVELRVDTTATHLGRITRITDPGRLHPGLQLMTSTATFAATADQEGFVTRFDYDANHSIIRITDPLGRTVARNEYDDDGRLIRSTNEDGRTWSLPTMCWVGRK
jgi:YD repeat-containing protein